MIAWIGNDVHIDGKWYHVQDSDLLLKTAKVGNPDDFNVTWDSFWIEFEKIKEQKKCDNSCKREKNT